MRSFEIWLKSPWCNTNKNLIRLFETVKKYYPDFDNQKLSKEKLFRQILPNGKYSARRMNNLLSEAYLTAERFLIFQNLAQDQNLQKDLLTKELQNRHLEDWFFKDANKEIVRLEKQQIKEWEDHLALLQLHRRIYHHPNQNPRMQPGSDTIVKMGEQIDLVYLLEKAAIINEKIFRNRILKNENHDIESELKKWRLSSEGIEHPAIDLYKMRFDYTEENMLEKYFELRSAFLERFEELNEKEQKVHLMSLLNDTTSLARAKLVDISETLFLYKIGLKTGALLNRRKLTHITYFTIVAASNTKTTFDFTIEFIQKYTDSLDEKYQSDAKNWALAHTAYRKEELENALDILLYHDFKTLFFQLSSKLLTAQVYFDLFLKDSSYQFYLFNYFDSFEKWLVREKIHAKSYQIPYVKFVQICRKIAKAYSEADFRVEKVENLLKQERNVQAPQWLSQKIEMVLDLKNRRSSKS